MENTDDLLLEKMRRLSRFTERLAEAKLKAGGDDLTGLASRGKAEAYLRIELESQRPVTAVLINLLGFKTFNHRYGHGCGDQVLVRAGALVSGFEDVFEMVCRWEGDKFLLVSKRRKNQLAKEIDSLREQLSRPYQVMCGENAIDVLQPATIGIAEAKSGDSVDDVIERAEANCEVVAAR